LEPVVKNHVYHKANRGRYKRWEELFSLSEQEKMKVRVGHLFRRHCIVSLRSNERLVYTSLLSENTNPQGLGDLHEGFDLGWELEIKQDDTTWSNSATAVSNNGVVTGRKCLARL